jgi:hypothetical protein
VVLGRYLQGISLNQQEECCQRLQKSSRRRPKLNLEILQTIVLGDVKQFKDTVTKQVRQFIKSNATPNNPGSPMFCIDFDVSILWNIARRTQMVITDFPEEIMDRIVTPLSIGLQS